MATTTNRQLLSDDVFWHTAKHYLHRPRDIMALACTSRSLWKTLEMELHFADVLIRKARSSSIALPKRRQHPCWTATSPHSVLYKSGRPVMKDASALHYAACQGDLRMARLSMRAALTFWPQLIETAGTSCLLTPLMLAAIYGHTDMVQYLVDNACSLHQQVEWCRHGFEGVSKWNLGKKMVSQRPGWNLSTLVIAVTTVTTITAVHNALTLAIFRGHTGAALILASSDTPGDADPEVAQVASLHIACMHKMTAVVDAILQRGGNVEMQAASLQGATPLHVASATEENTRVIDKLLDVGANIDAPDTYRQSPLEWALRHHCLGNALFLLSRGASVVGVSRERVLLQAASSDTLLPVTQHILSRNDRIPEEARLIERGDALVYALYHQEEAPRTIEYLLGILSKAPRFFTDDWNRLSTLWRSCGLLLWGGKTFLHIAIQAGITKRSVIEDILCSKICDIDAKDGSQCTALQCAMKSNKIEVAALLIQQGASIV